MKNSHDQDAERDDDLIPVAEVARHRGTTVRAVLELAKRDPEHPPLIGLSPSPRAPKFLRRGPNREYEALRERQAADLKRQRLAAKDEPRKAALPLTGSVGGKASESFPLIGNLKERDQEEETVSVRPQTSPRTLADESR